MATGSRRLFVLLAVFGLSASLVAYDRRSQAAPEIAEAAPRKAGGSSQPAAAAGPTAPSLATQILPLQGRDGYVASAGDPFAGSASPPPPLAAFLPAAAEAPVVVPTAPALPYTVIGKKLEADTWEVYLARGEHTLVARRGAVLDEVYRVEAIEPPTMALTYLPLNEPQSLAIGAPLHD